MFLVVLVNIGVDGEGQWDEVSNRPQGLVCCGRVEGWEGELADSKLSEEGTLKVCEAV